jgi:hypothetical protein
MMMVSRRLVVLVLHGALLLTISSIVTAEEPVASRELGDVRK